MLPYIVIAAVLQVIMVVTGHFNEFVLLNLSAALGVGIPLVVSFFYGRTVTAASQASLGGAAIGFIGAALGIGLAIILGDQTATLLLFGPASSAVTGVLGSLVGYALRPKMKVPV